MSFHFSIFIYHTSILPLQSSVIMNDGYISLYSHTHTHTHTHTHRVLSVPSWSAGPAGEVTCGGSAHLLRQTLPAELWSSTTDSISQSQVPASGSMGPGDIIVTPTLPLLSLMEAWSWWRGLVNNLGALVHFITWPARLAGTFALSALV